MFGIVVATILAGGRLLYVLGQPERDASSETTGREVDSVHFREMIGLPASGKFSDVSKDAFDVAVYRAEQMVRVYKAQSEIRATSRPQSTVVEVLASRGVIALGLFFLVQVFVSLFRYALRLNVSLDGRADVLEVLGPSATREHVAVLAGRSPDTFDLESLPKSPAEHLGRATKALIER